MVFRGVALDLGQDRGQAAPGVEVEQVQPSRKDTAQSFEDKYRT